MALGIVAGAVTDTEVLRLVALGFLGSYTTFSTWMLESVLFGVEHHPRTGLLNIAISLTAGLAAAWLGLQIGAAV